MALQVGLSTTSKLVIQVFKFSTPVSRSPNEGVLSGCSLQNHLNAGGSFVFLFQHPTGKALGCFLRVPLSGYIKEKPYRTAEACCGVEILLTSRTHVI